ncbi:MAG: hypothetical protein ACC658_17720 [Acidimicrobiia bacterium]
MKRRTLRWVRATVIVGGGALFLVLAVVVVSAVNSPQQGSTRPGAHEFRDLDAEGDASCERCHFPLHYQHEDLNTCSDCHAPEPDGHAARPVTCTTCHEDEGPLGATQSEPLLDTTTTAPTTTIPPDTTTTSVVP